MKDEQLIEQIAEIRASLATNGFMLVTILENILGPDHEDRILKGYDILLTKYANGIEDILRQQAGLSPRSEPREPALKAIDRDDIFKDFDWSKGNIH